VATAFTENTNILDIINFYTALLMPSSIFTILSLFTIVTIVLS